MHTFHASLRQAVAVAIAVVAGAAVASASAQAPAESQVTLPSGVTLTYVTEGDPDGEPLVLVAGTGMQLVDWPESLVRGLVERGFRVIRFDNRDVGLSTVYEDAPVPTQAEIDAAVAAGENPFPYSMQDLGADVVGLLDALEVPAAHLAGVSMGGSIATWAALDAPDRVLSLTLIATASGNPEQPILADPEAFAAVPPPPTAADGVEAFTDYWVALGHALSGEGFALDEEAVREAAARYFERWYDPVALVRQQTAVAFDFFVRGRERFDRLAEIGIPTVVIHGDDDPLVPAASGLELAESIPGAELRLVPGLGHDIPDGVVPELVDAIVTAAHEAGAALP